MNDRAAWLVVQEHCPQDGTVGQVVQVDGVEPPAAGMYLRCACGAVFAYGEAHALIAGYDRYHPLGWLTKLPPLDEPQDERQDEEIAA